MQASSVIPLLYVWMFHSIFGMVVEVKQMSTEEVGEEEVLGSVEVGI